MKQIKYIIIIAIIILMIILLLLGNALLKENKPISNIDYDYPETPIKQEVKQENKKSTYLYSNKIINKFFEYLNNGNNLAINYLLEEDNTNNLTKQNIIENYKNVKSFFAKEIYVQTIAVDQTQCGQYLYIRGIIRKNKIEENIYLIIKEDLMNRAYSINFINEQEFSEIKNNRMANYKAEFTIKANEYNGKVSAATSDKTICEAFLGDYINSIQNNPQLAYNLLDEQYKNLKFGNIENYINYIKTLNFKNIILEKFLVEEQDGYKQYMCKDVNDNYYIFKNTECMEYSVMLDVYTADIPQLVEKYNVLEENDKVQYNIQKLINATKAGDYRYAYNKLNESFKTTNFATQADFEKYIKTKYNVDDKIAFKSYEKVNNVSIYKIELTDKNGKKKTDAQIVMQLKEGTDFEMSFSKSE